MQLLANCGDDVLGTIRIPPRGSIRVDAFGQGAFIMLFGKTVGKPDIDSNQALGSSF